MRHTKLQTKLFRAYLSLACLVLFAFAAFFYAFVSKRLTSSELSTLSTINSSMRTQVDNALRDLDIVSVNINYSGTAKSMIGSDFSLNISEDMLNDMADFFIAMSGTELKADQINLYDYSGSILQAGLTTRISKSSGDADTIACLISEHQKWMERAEELRGTKVITLPYETQIYSKSVGTPHWYISLYRSFNNQYNRPVGIIETVKQCKTIFKSIISYEKKNRTDAASIYVFDSDGNVVYPYDAETEETDKIKQYYQNTQDQASDTTFKTSVDTSEYYAAKTVSQYSGYTYLTLQSSSVVLAPVHHLLEILLIVVAIFLGASAVISYRLSRSFIRPVKHLKHVIQRMELETLGQEEVTQYPVSVDELDELYQAFQHMSDKLKSSMNQLIEAQEQEMKSRTLALQSQINPHFYYNSLSSIIVLAENGDTDVVCRMCRNLSNIMRYITDTSSTVVPLKQEIDYVQKYLYCMKVRYQTSLEYRINIDENLLAEKVPKLIIQPLVENAIKYGTNCNPPWKITIRSHITESSWQIDVIDSGTGFTEEAIQKISQNIRLASENPGMPSLKINGLGMLNVYLRWKLFCKEEIIFNYGNTEEGHGIVSIGRSGEET